MSDLIHEAASNGMGSLSQTFSRCAAGLSLEAGFNVQLALSIRFEYFFPGTPVLTSQKAHALVQVSPIIINVAVPLPKHSFKLGHDASSQTVYSLFFLNLDFSCATLSEFEALIRIQLGFLNTSVVSSIFIGTFEVLFWPFCFIDGSYSVILFPL